MEFSCNIEFENDISYILLNITDPIKSVRFLINKYQNNDLNKIFNYIM